MNPNASSTTILGEHPTMKAAIARAAKLAASELSILLVGETGTGKELFAREIHRWSRRSGDLIDLNCAALPRDLAESLLFGHRKGAFTGAFEAALGLIADSDRGTLFLDEIASAPLEVQAKLLRVLETHEVRRVGETSKRKLDLRVVAAAQEDLGTRLAAGTMRADLVQRLGGAVLHLPPLRERGSDVGLLAVAFAAARGCTLSAGTGLLLSSYHWPGNVRELHAVITRAAVLTEGSVIGMAGLEEALELGASVPVGIEPSDDQAGSAGSLRGRLLRTCAAHGWSSDRIARALGLGRTTLFKHLKSQGVSLRKERFLVEHRLHGDDGGREVAGPIGSRAASVAEAITVPLN